MALGLVVPAGSRAAVTRPRGAISFTVLLSAGVAATVLLALALGPVARRVPRWVLWPTLGLLVVQLGLDLRAGHGDPARRKGAGATRPGGPTAAPEGEDTDPLDASGPRRGEGATVAWVLALPIAIGLLGFLPAAPLYALLYLRLGAGERWRLAVGTAGGLWALLYGAVKTGASPLHTGWLGRWLGE